MTSSKKINRRNFIRNAAVVSSFFIVPRHVLGGRGYVAPSEKIALGFIGCGRQAGGLHHRFANLAEAQVVAACDVYAAKL
jgi:hypothetical protein